MKSDIFALYYIGPFYLSSLGPIGSTYMPNNNKSPCRPLPAEQRGLNVAFLENK